MQILQRSQLEFPVADGAPAPHFARTHCRDLSRRDFRFG
jgi:hypothetical protein